MQSISTSRANSISTLGFPSKKMNCKSGDSGSSSRNSNRRVFHWKSSVDVAKEAETDCDNCTLDTSTSSSTAPALIEDYPDLPSVSIKDSPTKSAMTSKNKQRSSDMDIVRDRLNVRFAPGTAPEPTHKRKMKKRKHTTDQEDADPERWYTKQELKEIQQSCIRDVKTGDFMTSLQQRQCDLRSRHHPHQPQPVAWKGESTIDRFSERNRKRRKLARWQMYETTKAIRQFEAATETKVPPELLSEVLRIYSKPMEMDAIESALKVRTPDPDEERDDPAVQQLPIQNMMLCDGIAGTESSSTYARLFFARPLGVKLQGHQQQQQQHYYPRIQPQRESRQGL